MTKIILVRHGHVEGIKPERFRGRLELALTERGLKEAVATARHIGNKWQPEAVYTSPMGRCVATGAAIADMIKIPARAVQGLHDIDYGEWQGMTPEDARKRWPSEIESWYRTPHLAQIPSGESLQDVLARASRFLSDVVRGRPEGTVVFVGHDSVNRIILLHALDLGLSHYWGLKQEPCAINEIDFANGQFIIHSVNGTSHLDSAIEA